MEDKEKIIKQNYLREEIMDKGLDDNFIEFLQNKMPGTDLDIDNFSIQELELVLFDYLSL